MEILDVDLADLGRPARLWLPDGGPTAGAVVALHPAGDPSRDQPLFRHLAATVTPLGYAVLGYDRRPSAGDADVPLTHQAADALRAVAHLSDRFRLPVGIWAFSQGTWAAAEAAAASDRVAFLALVGCPAVSPAVQMRYHTDERLRRAGFDEAARADQLAVRAAVEDLRRGRGDRADVERALDRCRDQPWFGLSYLPRRLPDPLTAWPDMDHDPAPTYARITCPILLVYGEDEETVPVEPSIRVWRGAAAGHDLTVEVLPGVGHWPGPQTTGAGGQVDPGYTRVLADWFRRLPRSGR